MTYGASIDDVSEDVTYVTVYDVILITSWSSKVSRSETGDRIYYPCTSFKHALTENIVIKHEPIRIESVGEEAFRANPPPPKFETSTKTVLRSKSKATIDHPCTSFTYTLTLNIVLKNQLIWIRTLGEEAFWVTPPTTRKSKNIGLQVVMLVNYKLHQLFVWILYAYIHGEHRLKNDPGRQEIGILGTKSVRQHAVLRVRR